MKSKKSFIIVFLYFLFMAQGLFCAEKQKIDVDLTKLNSIMVYAEVYNMLCEPEKYVGKTIRMKGQFYVIDDGVLPEPLFACIIMDATACCAQGLEFRLKGDYKYPKDYPSEYSEITVTGTFFSESDGWFSSVGVKDAVMEIAK